MSEIGQQIPQSDVAERGKIEKLKPTESEFKGKRGYWRKYRPDGTYTWGYKYTPNADGRLTKEAQEVGEMMGAFNTAATAYQHKNQSRVQREAMRDADGRVRFVDAASAEQVARRNAWRPYWRASGAPVRSGVGGMLWRPSRDGWEPLGVTCLGTPLFGDGIAKGRQYDPDGGEWIRVEGEWVQV